MQFFPFTESLLDCPFRVYSTRTTLEQRIVQFKDQAVAAYVAAKKLILIQFKRLDEIS